MVSQIWLPDSYFKNANEANFHDVTAPNTMITIGPGGVVRGGSRGWGGGVEWVASHPPLEQPSKNQLHTHKTLGKPTSLSMYKGDDTVEYLWTKQRYAMRWTRGFKVCT